MKGELLTFQRAGGSGPREWGAGAGGRGAWATLKGVRTLIRPSWCR